jgi:hypothetical protein
MITVALIKSVGVAFRPEEQDTKGDEPPNFPSRALLHS